MSLATFLRVHSNSKEVSYLSCQNTYPNWKTISHIKLKFLLWKKLLDNLLLAKYLISAAATLTYYRNCTTQAHNPKCATDNHLMRHIPYSDFDKNFLISFLPWWCEYFTSSFLIIFSVLFVQYCWILVQYCSILVVHMFNHLELFHLLQILVFMDKKNCFQTSEKQQVYLSMTHLPLLKKLWT